MMNVEDLLGELYIYDCPAIPNAHTSALGKKNLVKSVSIYLTHQCNLNCKTCYIMAGEKLENELETFEFENIFKSLRNLNFDLVYFLGGEPMLRKDIFRIIELARKHDLYTSMNSNGFFIDSENARKLKEAGIDQIQISIDGDEIANDEIRGIMAFKRATNAIVNLKKQDIPVSIAYTVTSLFHNISSMVKIAENLGMDVLNVSVAEPFGNALKNDIIPKRSHVEKILRDLYHLKTDVKLTFNGFRFFIDASAYKEARKIVTENYHSCPAGKERFVINANGDIYGCELLMYELFLEGNIRKDSLELLWEKGFKIFRENKLPRECIECPFNDICQGGCPARLYQLFHEIRKDPRCNLKL